METVAFWIVEFAGIVVLLIAILGLCAFAVSEFYEWRHEPHRRSYQEGMKEACSRLGQDSIWFSESPETYELLLDLANRMNVSDARDKWRQKRNASSQISNEKLSA